jgi:cell division protein FtsQ
MWDDAASLRMLANGLIAIALLLFVFGAGYTVLHLPIFPVREMRITGDVHHVTRDQVQAIVQRELLGNFFTLDLARARSAFEKLPWVRQASLRRRWPDGLDVQVEEHIALGRWGSMALVNTHGEVFFAASDARLPVLTGPDSTSTEVVSRFNAFSASLSAIGRSVVDVELSARRAWVLKLDDGMVLKLGREDVEGRVARFCDAYPRSIARLKQQPAYVDLRYANGFAVRVASMRWEGARGI